MSGAPTTAANAAPHRRRAARWALLAALAIAGFVVASALDRPTHALFGRGVIPRIDWPIWPFVNAFGIAGLWLVVAIVYGIVDGLRARFRSTEATIARALAILAPVVVAGVGGEAVKLVVRRERPLAHPEYRFREWGPGWDDSSGLGLPSTHACVAFAAAAALSRLHPRGRTLWFGLAAACAVTRLQHGAAGDAPHFLSDVYAGGWIGLLAERIVNRELPRGWRPIRPPPATAGVTSIVDRPLPTPDAGAAPATWMTWNATLVLALAVLAVRVIYLRWLCGYELLGDEAYYWEWSRHPDWCYDTKGPGIALLVAASTALFGHAEWAVRLPMAICSALATLALARLAIACAGGNERAGFLAAAGFSLLPAYQANAQFCTQDGPFILIWILGCAATLRVMHRLEDRRASTLAWLALGATLGVGLLFKQSMLLLAPTLPICLWLRRRTIAWKPALLGGILLAIATAAAIVSPMIVWNAQRGWPTLRHVLGHLGAPGGDQSTPSSYSPAWTAGLIFAQIAAFGPPMIGLMAWAVFRTLRPTARATAAEPACGGDASPDPRRVHADHLLLVWCAIPSLAVYVAVTFWKKTEVNWPFPAFATLVVLAALWSLPFLDRQRAALRAWRADRRRPRPWLGRIRRRPETPVQIAWDWVVLYGVAGGVLLSFVNVLASTKLLGDKVDDARFTGSRALASTVGAARRAAEIGAGQRPAVMTSHYMSASLLGFYLPDHPPVCCLQARFGGRPAAQDFWPDTDPRDPARFGRDVILVGKSAEAWSEVLNLRDIETLDAERGIYLGRDYRGLK